ncbi:MAG: leucine-rich repeat domain-containing protein [Eubacterium sp.]|nr:leucine-rich repeat domain-containing protein [Eubacterium sp.]
MKRRVISMILALALVVSALFCFNVSLVFGATSGNCGASGSILQTGKNATFNYDSSTKTLTISGTGATKDYGETIANRPPWYDYKDEIEKVIINEGIEEIGTLNFYGFTALKSVSLPSTLKTISGGTLDYGAFKECSALENITLPQNLTTIEPYAFNGCVSLRSITFPDSLTSLGTYAFTNCTNLQTVKYGTGLTSTGSFAFYNAGVRNVTFSSTITKIDSYTFYGCSFTSVEIPQEITSIGTRAFANCTFLSSVTVNNPNTTFEGIIGEDPFNGSNQTVYFYGHKGSTTETFVVDHPNSDYIFVSMDPCDHEITHEETTLAPTCTEKGTLSKVCDDCGFVVSQTDILATDHNWEIVESYDETETDGHIYSLYICLNCEEEKEEIEHIAFVEGFYTYTNTATCTRGGFETYTCIVEGCGEVERHVVLTANHSVDEYTLISNPDCTNAGLEEGVCSVCGETVTREVPALGHQTEYVESLDNTLEDGHIYDLYICLVCEEEIVTSEHIEWVEDFYERRTFQPSTCGVDGLGIDTCSICSQVRIVTVPATGEHDWYETTSTAPTCTATGSVYYACHNCNLTRNDRIEALGHDYVLQENISVAPTCTDAGYNTWKCDRCGASTTDVVNALGHTVDELNYTIFSDPDCVNDGKAASVCTVCENEFEITLVALGHNYEDITTPIDDKPGHSIITPTCTRCNNQENSSTHHDEWLEDYYTTTIITQGSCVVAQITRDTCSICGETRTNTILAPGHKYVYTGLNDNGRMSYTCSVCDNVYTASPAGVMLLWNATYINTAPYDTTMGYLFELTGDGIINAKDYSVLVRLNKTGVEVE